MKLGRDFYNRHGIDVAQDLLGQVLVFDKWRGIITETEIYRGLDDEASHAFRGPTPRSKIMFGPSGFSYVYFIYGMYHCLNIVSEEEGSPSAVLIRSVKILDSSDYNLLNGPGKLCRAMGINLAHNDIDLVSSTNFYLEEGGKMSNFLATPRIGIKKATDKLWRFVLENK